MPVETWSVSTGTADFLVGVEKKLWVGFEPFKNFKSLFSTHGAVLGSESFDRTDWIALRDDAARCSSTLVGWRGIGVTELSCKMFGARVRFLAKFDWLLDFIEVLLHSFLNFCCVFPMCRNCVVAFDFADCC